MADPNNNIHMELDPADGQQYVLELRDRLLELMSSAQTIDDIEDKLRKHHPDSKLIDLAIQEARRQRSEPSKKNNKTRHQYPSFTGTLQNITSLAISKVSNLVREGVVGNKNENELSKYKIALIQFIIDDVLNLAADFVRRQKGNFIITRSDIRTAMHADEDLLDMFLNDEKVHPCLYCVNCEEKSHRNGAERLTSYKQKVRSMVDSENSFIRDLKLIIKVFKAQLEKLPNIRSHVQIIFYNIDDLLRVSNLLLNVLEDALESVGQEDEIPYVGCEILDLAQAEEFHTYFLSTYNRLNRTWREAFEQIIHDPSTMTSIKTAGLHFDQAVRHLLPSYLLDINVQFFRNFNNITDLYDLSKKNDNRQDEYALRETISILVKTKKAMQDLLEREASSQETNSLDQDQAKEIKSSLEKSLDVVLEQERDLPLPFMPHPEIYRFSEPDSRENILFEDSRSKIPVIRYATLIKLVERLTYHKYQPNIVETFLTTYRSFTDSEELLDLLIERFKIPDPPIFVVFPNFDGSLDELPEYDRIAYKQYLRKFRQEYSKPVKMRVINVLKSWIKNHYYDFERQPKLSEKLNNFLDEVYDTEKVLRGLIVSIKNSFEQKKVRRKKEFEFMLSETPPPTLWLTVKEHEPEKFDLLTLHPTEFARQLTLIEFDLFRAIKPSELMDGKDLGRRAKKERRDDSSPNLGRFSRHFDLFSYWIRKCIVEADDFDKRVAMYNRAVKIMAILRTLNNYAGLLSIGCAIQSGPITKLSRVREAASKTTKDILKEYEGLISEHFKNLQLELNRCNPPCIPYIGSYKTKMIQAVEGNKTFIDVTPTTSPTLSNDEFAFSNSPATPISPRTPRPPILNTNSQNPPLSATSTMQNQFFSGPAPPKMINFYKQRIRASLVAEISNYQNSPYCLNPQPAIRRFILSIEPMMQRFAIGLDPKEGDENYWMEPDNEALTKRLDDYLYERAEKIEPRNSGRQPGSKSKPPELCWKSTSIKI